ncbi:MAG: hypothetical protein K2J11_00100, partial [Oscillospiraceae bacterium]|nr:hypothetical protein [Oscillospiraceae bacterium]
VYIDTKNCIYKIGEQEIGSCCKGMKITISPGGWHQFPVVTLELRAPVILTSENVEIQEPKDEIIPTIDDKSSAMVENSDK